MTLEQFVARFRQTMTAGRKPCVRRGDADLNPGMEGPSRLTPAAVLVPVVGRPAELTILLTRRTDHLADHAGQISFPGGRIEVNDPTPESAALREAQEEIGLPPERVRLLGRLEPAPLRKALAGRAVEWAAWVHVATLLLNLDETITSG